MTELNRDSLTKPFQHESLEPDTLKRIERVLAGHSSKLQSLIDTLRRSIPSYVDERAYFASGTLINLTPQSNNLELITSMIITVTSAGVLTLNDRVLNFTAGNYVYSNLGILLRLEDIRTLSQATPGVMSLELMGIELPDKGPF
jgi:hypothetical protein